MMNGVKMKNLNKKDYKYLVITILLFLIIFFTLNSLTFYYGSTLDWYSQHISIPEYFRTLFYESKEIIPKFAMNIGGGQNIYNFSYYGLFSPIILISYLFPFIEMVDFLILSSVILNILSTVFLYIFLRKKKFSEETSFLSSILFILADSLTFHSHRHLMFANYMLFLILGFFGIDKKIEKNKNSLLTISVFLMIMTSYYFSISGILVLVIYYFYPLKLKNINFKKIFNHLISISIPLLISVLASAVLIIPTFYTLVINRNASNTLIAFNTLFLPSADNIDNILYNSYGIGLSFLSFIAILNLFNKDKKHFRLGILLILITFLNIFNFILNGFIYVNAKSLIPFLPLFIYVTAIFIEDIFKKKVQYRRLLILITLFLTWILIFGSEIKYLLLLEFTLLLISFLAYLKYSKKIILIIMIIVLSFVKSYVGNHVDYLENKVQFRHENNDIKTHLKYIDFLEKNSNDFYRININYRTAKNPNKLFNNINYYNATSYSSIDNRYYNRFYYDYLTNEMPYRNRMLVVSSNNLLSNMLLGNKYFISREKAPLLYNEVKFKNFYLYENKNVLPIAYFNSNLITYNDFEKMNKYEQQVGFLKLIVNDKISKNNYKNSVVKEDIKLEELFNYDGLIKNDDSSIEINAEHGFLLNYKIGGKYKDKILFIKFNLKEQKRDLRIKINGMENVLTNKNWKYFNGNNDFNYTLSIKDEEELKIMFTKGKYIIKDLEVYSLDVDDIKDIRDNIVPLNINNKTANTIEGNIEAKEDGYLIYTIGYDKGFTAYVDGKEVEIEKLDYSFIGIPLTKGVHKVMLEYNPPLQKEAIIISLIGIFAFIINLYIEKKKSVNN